MIEQALRQPSVISLPAIARRATAGVIGVISVISVIGGICSDSTAAEPSPYAPGITEPFLDLTLSSAVPGIVTTRKFQEGDSVKQGQVILELDKRLEELELHRRALVRDMLEKDLAVTRKLFETTSGVSKEELEKKELEHRIAVVEHDVAAEQLRRRQVIAPADGAITDIVLDIGESCQAYQPVIRLVDTRRCYFVANLEAADVAGLQLDQLVTIEIETGTSPLTLPARIVYLSPVVDPASGLLKVKALFDNTAGHVRPGLAGRIVFRKYAE